jgi:predicted short-subunit dehydrogenase-like oxidoreductase (DUF2520 family)
LDRITIIGYGKLGSHLYHALRKHTKYISIMKNSHSKYSKKVIESLNLIFICTQDSKIPQAVKSLKSLPVDLKGKYIFHTSGLMDSGELGALKRLGAHTASFHPVQTFEQKASKDEKRFKDIFIAVEGGKIALTRAKQISKVLGAKPFVISKGNKLFHHLCCVMASNFLSTLVRQIEKTGSGKIRINGFKNPNFINIYMPLALQSLKNASAKGAARSLSGPIERNDISTVSRHLEALKKGPQDVYSFYLLMGIETVKLALEKKSIKPGDAKIFLNLFSKHINKQ